MKIDEKFKPAADLMRLAVGAVDKHLVAACGDDPVTVTADEAFALFMLVRFANSHPKLENREVCLAGIAIEYLQILMNGRCPDCGVNIASGAAKEGHDCSNHCNEYPLPDDAPDNHPPKEHCH